MLFIIAGLFMALVFVAVVYARLKEVADQQEIRLQYICRGSDGSWDLVSYIPDVNGKLAEHRRKTHEKEFLPALRHPFMSNNSDQIIDPIKYLQP